MTLAAETNATRQQSWLGGQRGTCSRGTAGKAPAACSVADGQTHTDTQMQSVTIPSLLAEA